MRQLAPYNASSYSIEGWPASPTVHSRHSSGIVCIVLDMRYGGGGSAACARAVIGKVTGRFGRGEAPVRGAAAAAGASWPPRGTKWKLPPTKSLRASAILSILYSIRVVRRPSREQSA